MHGTRKIPASWKTYQTTLRVPQRAGHVFFPPLFLGKVEGTAIACTLRVISAFDMNFPTSYTLSQLKTTKKQVTTALVVDLDK